MAAMQKCRLLLVSGLPGRHTLLRYEPGEMYPHWLDAEVVLPSGGCLHIMLASLPRTDSRDTAGPAPAKTHKKAGSPFVNQADEPTAACLG